MQSTGIPERNRLTQSLLGGKVQVGLWQLYKILKKNEDLKARRHPMFEKNRFMKFLAWFFIIYSFISFSRTSGFVLSFRKPLLNKPSHTAYYPSDAVS